MASKPDSELTETVRYRVTPEEKRAIRVAAAMRDETMSELSREGVTGILTDEDKEAAGVSL